MTEQVGTRIKEARTDANMTQKELAEAVDGLSARSISEAERGLRELTDEQLAAIAEVTGSESLLDDAEKDESPEAPAEATGSESLLDDAGKDESPEAPAEAAAVPAVDKEDILEMFNAADPAVKRAALSVLKGETAQGKSFLDNILPMVGELLGNIKGDNPLPAIMGFLASEEGMAFLGTLKGTLGNVAGMFSRNSANKDDAEQDGRKAPNSLLIFTFSYAVAIYILLLSFYFWLIRTDIKPEK